VHAGREAAVLVGIAVDGEVDEVGADAAVVQQRVALPGRRRRRCASLLLAGNQERQQVALGAAHLLAEAGVGLDLEEAVVDLVVEQLAHARGGRMRGGRMREVDPERSAMRPELLDVDDLEAVQLGQPVGGDEREVGEVLVVDGVELVVGDQPLEMRN
jgi:hypothetical protein